MLFCQYPKVPIRQPACGARCRRSSFPAASLPRRRFDRKVAYKALIRNHFLVKGAPRINFTLSFPARQGTGGGDANSPCCFPQTRQRLPASRPPPQGANYLIYRLLWPIWRVISGAESSFLPAQQGDTGNRPEVSEPCPRRRRGRRRTRASSRPSCSSPSGR